jgi:hypothetical protein
MRHNKSLSFSPSLHLKLTLLFGLIFLAVVPAQGQKLLSKDWPLDVPKQSAIVVKIPGTFLGFEKFNVWRGTFNYTAYIRESSDGVLVNDSPLWKYEGWPLMSDVFLEKISRKKEYTEVELRSGNTNVKLRFAPDTKDLNAAFKQVAFVGSLYEFERSEYYQKEVLGHFLPQIFKGPLAKIPREHQILFMKAAKYDIAAVGSEEYKGRFYMVLRGINDDVYNTLQLNQAERTARVTEQYVLSALRAMNKAVGNIEEIEGVKFEVKVPYKDFVSEQYQSPHYDDLHIYAPMELIKKFDEADITNQDLIDGSVVLVNGNRVRVSLTQFR